MFDLQQIFNAGYLGVIAQHAPSMDRNHNCQYRGPNNTKCALGFSIPDAAYRRAMEGLSVDQIFCVTGDDAEALTNFQGCHDHAAIHSIDDDTFVRDFTRRATEFAQDYNLTVPES
jgi:hypothetical protein